MDYTDIFAKIKNRLIVPYLMILKESQYLIIKNENDNITHRFFKKDGNIKEIYNIFSSHDISEYYSSDDVEAHPWSVLSYNEEESRRCSYTIYDRQGYIKVMKEQLKKDVEDTVQKRNGHDAYSVIRHSLSRDGGKFVTFDNCDNIEDSTTCGLLVAASTTDEDCYYIYIDKDLDVCFMSAVGGYRVIKDDKFIEYRFKRLKHLFDNTPEHIAEMVEKKLEDSVEYIFTSLTKFRNKQHD